MNIDDAIKFAHDGMHGAIAAALAREVVRLRGATAVVVPEPTSDEWRAIAENARSADMVDFLAGAAAYGLWLRGKIPNSIPAYRVPGEGMVAVSREEWKRIVTLLTHLLCDEDAYEKIDKLLEPISKLRFDRDGKGWIGIMVSDALGASTPEIDDFFVCPASTLRANQGGAGHD